LILSDEIDKINNKKLKSAVTKCISEREDMLKMLPATLTGKHHPPDERGPGGFILHIRRVVWFVNNAADTLDLDKWERDVLTASAIMHDISAADSSTVEPNGRITRCYRKPPHPKISASIAISYLLEAGYTPTSDTIIAVHDLISSHSGKYEPECKRPYNILETILSLGDYITTREETKIEV
jgi:hypothetical protein